MSGTPLLPCATPDNCSSCLASGTPKSSIENLDPQVWACRSERNERVVFVPEGQHDSSQARSAWVVWIFGEGHSG